MNLLKFHTRKHWYFKSGKIIGLEITGCHQTPHLSFRMDGDEQEVQLHIALFIGVWLTFARFIPMSWFPKRKSSLSDNGWLPDECAFKVYWYEWGLWWNFWMPKHEWNSNDPKWRRGCIHFDNLIIGKRTVRWEPLDRDRFYLPFFEGCYQVVVTKKLLIETWPRWFTRKSISFEVESPVGIPHEGKGENSWDCGEDATYAMSFHSSGLPRRYNSSCFDAAMYFWTSCMQDRKRYAYAHWVPKKYRPLNAQLIEKDGVKVVCL